MSHLGIHLRTPDATPGSFVKILWDFTRNTLGSTQPPQYELFKSRINHNASKYWAVAHIPPVDPNQGPTSVVFIGKSMPTSEMAIEVAAYEAITRLRFAVPRASERGYYYFPSRPAPGEEASFPCRQSERDPMLANLVQYVIAQERLTQQVMDFLQTLAVLNPQIAIGGPLFPDQGGNILRLLHPLSPGEEEDVLMPGIFPQDPINFSLVP